LTLALYFSNYKPKIKELVIDGGCKPQYKTELNPVVAPLVGTDEGKKEDANLVQNETRNCDGNEQEGNEQESERGNIDISECK
jgi:hypothetical protein